MHTSIELLNVIFIENLSVEDIVNIDGGRNSWQTNVAGVVYSTAAGFGLGAAICGPACGVVGAHYGPIMWAAATGFTGGFGNP